MTLTYRHRPAIVAAVLVVGCLAAAEAGAAYSQEILDLNPVGYWRLGESSGTTATDLSGNGLDGSYNGSITLGATGALTGDSDTAASFSGAGYVQIDHDDSLLLNDGSVLLWFNASDTTGGGLATKDASGFVDGGHLAIRTDNTGRLSVRLQSTTDEYLVSTADPILADQWYFVAFTFGSGGMNLYVDGSLADSDPYTGGLGTSSGGTGNTEPLALGANTWGSTSGDIGPLTEYYSGLLDEVAILDTALTGTQLQALYTEGTVPEPTVMAMLATGGMVMICRRRHR